MERTLVAMVYNGRVYVYMTNDILEYSNGQIGENKYGTITEIDCISSSDLVKLDRPWDQ